MNQNKIKVNPKYRPRRFQNRWLSCHFIMGHIVLIYILFMFISFFLFQWGLKTSVYLSFQIFLISILVYALHCWIFFKKLKSLFPLQEIKGYDSWHLRPLLDKLNFKSRVFLTVNEAPFCFSYDFFSPRLILSTSLLKKITKNELEALLTFQKIYFENKWIARFTQFVYITSFFLSPLLILHWFLNKISIHFLNPIFNFILSIFLWYRIFPLNRDFSPLVFQTISKEQFILLLQKLQSYLTHSSLSIPYLFSIFLFTNPLTSHSEYHKLRFSIDKRTIQ